MLAKKLKKSGLIHFSYKNTVWYQTISTENRQYKSNLLFYFLFIALCIPVLLIFDEFNKKSTQSLIISLSIISVIGLLIFLSEKLKKIKLVIFLVLCFSIIASLFAVYAPSGRNIYLIIFSFFPILAIHLRGSLKGSIWNFIFTFLFLSAYASQKAGFIPPWTVSLPAVSIVTLLTSLVLVHFLAYFSERRYESLIERLTDMFVFDDATGLPNKDVLIHSIEKNHSYIFAIIEIVNYSDLVALFGYEFSDIISQFASQKLLKNERHFHYKTYQLKYNEYGILIETEKVSTIAETTLCINSVMKSLDLEALPWETDKIRLVYRVGATIIDPADSRSPLSKADAALKKGERGHSPITIFENDNSEKENARDYVIKFTDLINNRENDSFRAVFQPIFNSDGTSVEWYEALLRIKRQDGTYSSIFPYLSVARSTGFYQYLTDFILKKTAEAICEYDVDISVNITINDIVRPEFIVLVDEVYEQIKDKKGRIIFEILESDELVELDNCLWFIDYISGYGFKIAIDDFGTGYSNYCSLVNLPIDIVKIDGALIKKIQIDENAKTLVEGIVHFCKKSKKKIVAEFVEDKQVFDSLHAMGIDFLQGYYLGVPASIAECPCFDGV